MKILVGFDGSNSAKDALSTAKKFADAFKASVAAVTSMVKGTAENQNEILQAERGLEYAKSFFDNHSIPCETHLLIRGMTPGEDIVQFVRENDIGLIVVGVKRRSKVGKLLMGSTAQYIILNASCPVLSVR